MSDQIAVPTAYSGEISPATIPAINIDVFGLDDVTVSQQPDLWQGAMGETHEIRVQFPAVSPIMVVEAAPAGWYYLRARGAYKVFGEGILPTWSPYQAGWWNTSREGSPVRGAVLRLGGDDDKLMRLPEFGFNEIGFATIEEAEGAAAGATKRFWHDGGDIEFLVDDPYEDEIVGSLIITVTKGTLLGDRQGWLLLDTTAPIHRDKVQVTNVNEPRPTFRNLVPGLYTFLFWVHDPTVQVRHTQRVTLHVWETMPRLGDRDQRGRDSIQRDNEQDPRYTRDNKDVLLSPQRFPVKPPMTRDANSPALNRNTIEPEPRYSGQLSERPEESKQTRWKQPRKLSGDEEF